MEHGSWHRNPSCSHNRSSGSFWSQVLQKYSTTLTYLNHNSIYIIIVHFFIYITMQDVYDDEINLPDNFHFITRSKNKGRKISYLMEENNTWTWIFCLHSYCCEYYACRLNSLGLDRCRESWHHSCWHSL